MISLVRNAFWWKFLDVAPKVNLIARSRLFYLIRKMMNSTLCYIFFLACKWLTMITTMYKCGRKANLPWRQLYRSSYIICTCCASVSISYSYGRINIQHFSNITRNNSSIYLVHHLFNVYFLFRFVFLIRWDF